MIILFRLTKDAVEEFDIKSKTFSILLRWTVSNESVSIMDCLQIGVEPCFLKLSSFEVKVLKFLMFLGGFPLSIIKEREEKSENGSNCRFSPNKIALASALIVSLLPGLIILSLLAVISIQWQNFTIVMNKAGYTFWDILSIVSNIFLQTYLYNIRFFFHSHFL